MADQRGVTVATCDSCGRDQEEVVEVVRLYVVTEAWDQEPSITEAEGTERWCFPCRTHYPHRLSPHRLPGAAED